VVRREEHVLKPDVAILGIPLDDNSSHLRGAAQAPTRIREVLHDGASNLVTEAGLDLSAVAARWEDYGDLALGTGADALAQIEAGVARRLAEGARVLCWGGDHSITWPILRAYARAHAGLTVLHLDAHPDLYDEFQGKRDSHACPFARVLEEKLIGRLVSVGIRAATPHQREQATRFGVTTIEMRQWQRSKPLGVAGPLYVSLDLDVLDPAFAPGVSHHEPGGMSVRDVLAIIGDVDGPIVGADIVEYNPTRDPLGMTAAVAVKLTKELVGRMLS
jgi:agmatinase